MSAELLEPVAPTDVDVRVARESSPRLSRLRGRALRISAKGGAATEMVEIPAGAVPIIQHVLACMAQGLAVSLVPVHSQLTTQQAATLLGVSRPFLIKLLSEKAIPCTKVNRHRRIVLQDLLDYKHKMHAARQQTLAELAAEGQRLGVGY
jgi:excisionase family DNA binding protein